MTFYCFYGNFYVLVQLVFKIIGVKKLLEINPQYYIANISVKFLPI